MKSPIAFFIFNRPDTAEKVFQAIKRWKPTKLYVFADGPRNADELQVCLETRKVIDQIDWDCEVIKKFSDTNLGCKRSLAGGLDYVFEREEQAIILEDDCLPDQSFFPYCEELLEKYKDDTRIGAISGNNFQFENTRTENDYFFSRYYHVWGWATWARSWKLYDHNMTKWPYVRDNKILRNVLDNIKQIEYWSDIFQQIYLGNVDTWDYQLSFSLMIQNMLFIHPERNLVSNIGFDARATHTKVNDIFANYKTQSINFPLRHPNIITRCKEADDHLELVCFSGRRPATFKQKIKDIFPFLVPIYRTIRTVRHLRERYELFPFREKYAAGSLHHEIKKILENKQKGIFIEVGANDGFLQSNTAYLEKYLGWQGILIEAIHHKFVECSRNRPKANVEHGALVSFAWDKPFVELQYCNLMSIAPEISVRDSKEWLKIGRQYFGEEGELLGAAHLVPAITLDQVLKKYNYTEIDFFSLDVEGAELEVLKGINFDSVKFKNILVETSEIEKIETYLKQFGYINMKKITQRDYLFKPNEN